MDYNETLNRKKRMLERLQNKIGPFNEMTPSEAQRVTILETEIRMIQTFLVDIHIHLQPSPEPEKKEVKTCNECNRPLQYMGEFLGGDTGFNITLYQSFYCEHCNETTDIVQEIIDTQ